MQVLWLQNAQGMQKHQGAANVVWGIATVFFGGVVT